MSSDRSRVTALILACVAGAVVSPAAVNAAVLYTTPGATYTQDFNSLPTTPEKTSLQSTIPWTDDQTSGATQTSLVGWYLYHPTDQSAGEGGVNGHQRFRIVSNTAGVPNTGAFYSFGSTGADTNRSLGDVGANTLAPDGGTLWMAVRITNNTGLTLTSAQIGYTGEEWRDGGSTTAPEHLVLAYSTTATSISDPDTAFTAVVPMTFVPPVATGTAASLDGHAAANRHVFAPFTITGLSWAPGTDLWVRWSDPQVAGAADDGLAIDDFTFSATAGVPEPASPALLAAAAAGLPLISRRRRRA